MYTIQELQAADFLLKRITQNSKTFFYNKNLKLVVFTMNNYWYGDFIVLSGIRPLQPMINDSGQVETIDFYSTGTNATSIFKKIWDTYLNEAAEKSFFSNPFETMNTHEILFNTLMKVVRLAKITPDDSPIYPYLLNAHSLDGKLQLPFLNMSQQDVNVVSLIEVPTES